MASQLVQLKNGSDNLYPQMPDKCPATKTAVTSLTTGTPYSSWGGVYYYKYGPRVYVHVGVNGLTNTSFGANNLFTLPTGYRPSNEVSSYGQGQTVSSRSVVRVTTSGSVIAYSENAFCMGNVEFDVF